MQMNFLKNINYLKKRFKDPSKIKVAVALSGGIDSSVCAFLLKKAGFKVRGFFLNLYDSDFFEDSLSGAKKMSEILEIPFVEVDARKEFKRDVIKYFLFELKNGRTPNPCVVCNEKIKMGILLKKAVSSGMDFLATGHYVKKEEGKIFKILMAKDKSRDQSYFLWKLSQDKLSKLLFPLGDITKKDILKEAEKIGILDKERKESREICFVEKNIEGFVSKFFKEEKGLIIDQDEKIIGKHKGLFLYTIGQRKGIKLSGGPYYVLNKDLKRNVLIVTKNEKDLFRKKLICSEVNWISGLKPSFPLKVEVKTRYAQRLSSAILKNGNGKDRLEIEFKRKQRAITPGQSVVFYISSKGEWEMIGGGVIENFV
jgi:tRNA-specific 2-thiouridylase